MPQTLTVPTIEEVRTAIAMGRLDDHLDDIEDAVRRRRPFTAPQLIPGDMVRVSKADVRPRYLYNTMWRVERVNKTTVSLKPQPGELPADSRYRFGLRIPMEYVRPADG